MKKILQKRKLASGRGNLFRWIFVEMMAFYA